MRSPLRPLLTLVLVAGLALAGCGDDDDPTATRDGGTTASTVAATGGDDDYGGTTGGASTDDASAEPAVVAEGIAFVGDIVVAPGEEFFLDNQDTTPHTLTADDGSFDSGQVSGGTRSDAMTAPDEPGDFPFHCEIHPGMSATLTVTG